MDFDNLKINEFITEVHLLKEFVTMVVYKEKAGTTISIFPLKSKTLPPATTTNSYIVSSGQKAILIDIGSYKDSETEKLIQYLDDNSLAIEYIILTHNHTDHSAGLSYFLRHKDAQIGMHNLENDLQGFGSDEKRYITLEDNQEFTINNTAVRIIHTPGHTAGSVSVYIPQLDIVICGDLMASEGTVVIDPHEGNMDDYLASLQKIKSLNPKIILPGHGGPIDNPGEKIDEYITHRLWRENLIYQSIVDGCTTIEAIVKKSYEDVPVFLHQIARLSALAHLERLKKNNRISIILSEDKSLKYSKK